MKQLFKFKSTGHVEKQKSLTSKNLWKASCILQEDLKLHSYKIKITCEILKIMVAQRVNFNGNCTTIMLDRIDCFGWKRNTLVFVFRFLSRHFKDFHMKKKTY